MTKYEYAPLQWWGNDLNFWFFWVIVFKAHFRALFPKYFNPSLFFKNKSKDRSLCEFLVCYWTHWQNDRSFSDISNRCFLLKYNASFFPCFFLQNSPIDFTFNIVAPPPRSCLIFTIFPTVQFKVLFLLDYVNGKFVTGNSFGGIHKLRRQAKGGGLPNVYAIS